MQQMFDNNTNDRDYMITMRERHLESITNSTIEENAKQHLIGIGALFMSRILPYDLRTTEKDLFMYQTYVTESREQDKKTYKLYNLLLLNQLLQHNHNLMMQ
jgi:hypothetical protein